MRMVWKMESMKQFDETILEDECDVRFQNDVIECCDVIWLTQKESRIVCEQFNDVSGNNDHDVMEWWQQMMMYNFTNEQMNHQM